MVYDFNGKVALVTGGANGIGYAMVKELLKQGVKGVAVLDFNEKLGAKIAAELNTDKVYFIKTDVTNATEFEENFKKTINKFGRLDIVCNNAGIWDEQKWELCMSVNIKAVVDGTLFGFKYMGKNNGGQGGVIVNTGSVLGLQSIASGPVYTGTKHFVVSFDRAFGTKFYYDVSNVRVLTICPGFTDTGLLGIVTGLPGFNGSNEYALNQIKSMQTQPAENVGKGLITAINEGENGSAWVAALNQPAYEEKANKPTYV